jgi:hypothetical protein
MWPYGIRFKVNGAFIFGDIFVENIDDDILVRLVPFMSAVSIFPAMGDNT